MATDAPYTPEEATPRRIIVTGSRTWADTEAIARALTEHTRPGDVIVHGACPTGADAIADRWARANGRLVEAHPANWALYGKAAGPVRNEHMVKLGAAVVLAFPLGRSVGTRGCMRSAQQAGIRVIDLTIDPSPHVDQAAKPIENLTPTGEHL